VSPVRYELSFYIPEDNILHGDRCENLKSYNIFVGQFVDVCMLFYLKV
jgi:hypothetical protein